MLTYGGALVDLMSPNVGNHQLVYQLNAHAAARKIAQESMLNLRPLKHINDTTVNLNSHRTPPPPPPPWKPPPPPWNDE